MVKETEKPLLKSKKEEEEEEEEERRKKLALANEKLEEKLEKDEDVTIKKNNDEGRMRKVKEEVKLEGKEVKEVVKLEGKEVKEEEVERNSFQQRRTTGVQGVKGEKCDIIFNTIILLLIIIIVVIITTIMIMIMIMIIIILIRKAGAE